jgi:hypothetical protein
LGSVDLVLFRNDSGMESAWSLWLEFSRWPPDLRALLWSHNPGPQPWR